MDLDKVNKRMLELMEPVDRQLMMCDNREDTLMMACCMMQRCFEVFDHHITPEGADAMILGELNKRMTQRALNRKYGDYNESED